jgi:hypothetical protein
MKINLKDLKIAYIIIPIYPNRNQTMINMLEHYGLNYYRVEGSMLENHDPIAKSHLIALESGPDIILEDDCLPFDYREEIDIPDDSDVVFLGISSGTTQNYIPKYEKISNDIYKLNDMTTVHAILYVTEAGRQWLRNAYKITARVKPRFDRTTAILMPTINAYGLNSPIWYQRDLASETALTMDEALLFDDYHGGGFEDYDEPYTIF